LLGLAGKPDLGPHPLAQIDSRGIGGSGGSGSEGSNGSCGGSKAKLGKGMKKARNHKWKYGLAPLLLAILRSTVGR